MNYFIKETKIYKRIYQHTSDDWKSAELYSQGQLGMGHWRLFALFLTRINSTSGNHVYDPFHKPLKLLVSVGH